MVDTINARLSGLQFAVINAAFVPVRGREVRLVHGETSTHMVKPRAVFVLADAGERVWMEQNSDLFELAFLDSGMVRFLGECPQASELAPTRGENEIRGLLPNVNLEHFRSPNRVQLETAFGDASGAAAFSFQTNGTVVFEAKTDANARGICEASATLAPLCG